MKNNFQYQLALTMFKGIGPIGMKAIIARMGGIEAIFEEKTSVIHKLNISPKLFNDKLRIEALEKAEKEIKFIEENDISALFYLDKDYPKRLRNCDDCPIVLYKKGNSDLNPERTLAIVGTRNASDYGKESTTQIVNDLKDSNITIISGLAYGIDISAHRAALKNNLSTFGVLGQDLGRVYPKEHKKTATEMLENGALLSEFPSSAPFHPGNFPARNRIIAGLSDAVLVIESKTKGGAIITAEIANSYNKDVFALPGNINQERSKGCNNLIKSQKAQLIASAEDIIKFMSWDTQKKKKQSVQRSFFIDLDETQAKIVNVIKDKAQINIDDLSINTTINIGKLSAVLLDLELKGVVQSLPGKCYKLA